MWRARATSAGRTVKLLRLNLHVKCSETRQLLPGGTRIQNAHFHLCFHSETRRLFARPRGFDQVFMMQQNQSGQQVETAGFPKIGRDFVAQNWDQRPKRRTLSGSGQKVYVNVEETAFGSGFSPHVSSVDRTGKTQQRNYSNVFEVCKRCLKITLSKINLDQTVVTVKNVGEKTNMRPTAIIHSFI